MRGKTVKKPSFKAPKIFLIVVFVSFFVLLMQLGYVALFPSIYGINMKEFAATRNTYAATLYAKRGSIYDNEGNTLALNVSSYTVIAYLSEKRTGASKTPLHVVDKEKTAEALSPILNMSIETLINLLSKDVYQVELGPGGRGISELKKQEIQALKLPGIDFIESYKRYYPNGDFASYIVGYAKTHEIKDEDGHVDNVVAGELGLELKYEKLLTGINGYLKYQRDRHGYKIPASKEERVDSKDGADIYLTLDSSVQRFAESAIKDIAKIYDPTWATISVMEAKTGKILAASTIPSFDPNFKNITSYQSPIVTDLFEPGSVMKIYSYLCAIDSGKYDSNYLVQTGSVNIGDDIVRDWNRDGWGIINMDSGFIRSSNVVTATLAQKFINKSDLRECYDKFGFGQATGVELSKEVSGLVNFTYPIEVVTAAFGQGITTTVVQQLQAMSIIANNGQMIKPRIVDKIIDPNTNKILYESALIKSEQLVKPSSISKIKDLLELVINNEYDGWATGRNYYMHGYDLIGKTGTAQIGSSRGYLTGENDYLSSFIGMYPKNDPELIIYVAIKQPKWGATTALQNSVKELVANTAKYLNLFSKNSVSSNTEQMVLNSYISKNSVKIKQELESKGINVILIGNGDKIVSQYPSSNTTVVSKDKVFLITNDPKQYLPNFKHWSKKDVEKLLTLLNIKYTMNGSGYVVSQSVLPEVEITPDINIEFFLEDSYNFDEI